MSTFIFTICLLATFRLTSIIYQEEIASFIRKYVGGYDGISYPDNFIGQLFNCYWCLSVWVGAFVYGIYLLDATKILYPFALSAGAMFLYELKEKLL